MRTLQPAKRDLTRRNLIVPCEVRAADGADGEMVIEGYAAVFDQVVDARYFKETVKAGAFKKTLMERDQVALWDHETFIPLGRKSRGTLELREDDHGLFMRAKLDPNISTHKDAYLHIKRGDVTGMSFGFDIIKESADKNSTPVLYEIEEVRLYEVSPCSIPFYDATEVHARCEITEERAQAILELRQAMPGETTDEPEATTTPQEPEAHHSEAGATERELLTLKRKQRNRNHDL